MPGPVLGTFAHLPKAVVAGVAGAVVLAGGAVAAVQLTSGSDADQLSDASKVLQSVDVGVGPNGRLTSIKGTTVGTTTSGKQFSVDKTYEPGKVADQLPVRVLTSYRTAKGSGTDLADLDGYTGRIDITLTVQNLTQKAKNVTFDVGGTQQSRSALVGVPLTVVGSTALPDTKPSDVVSQAGSKDDSGTNGVLSQDAKGKTQVQWATLLAPPQLGASTAMNLSVNAKDFTVPDFDLSVQPGLVTDPSIGSVLDEAFAPEGSSQLALTRRTIDLIGKVNGVLGQAGKSMSQVRTTLRNSSATLGTKTVSDLKGSTETIASSVKGLQESSQSLGQDLTGSLKGTQSQTLAELQQTTQAINSLLGDTNGKVPQATITQNPGGSTCDVTVNGPRGAKSIYGNLQEIASLLDGYSRSNGDCAKTIADTISNAVGPDTAAACLPGNQSASCSLFNATARVNKLYTDLSARKAKAVSAFENGISGLEAAIVGAHRTSYPETHPDPGTDEAKNDARCFDKDTTFESQPTLDDGLDWYSYQLRKCAGVIGGFAIDTQRGGDSDTVDASDFDAAAVKAKEGLTTLNAYLYDLATQGLDDESTALSTSASLSDEICDRVNEFRAKSLDPSADPATKESAAADAEKIEQLRRYTNNLTCPYLPLGLGSRPINTSDDSANLDAQLKQQQAKWQELSNDFAPRSEGGVGSKMQQVSSLIDQVVAEVNKLQRAYNIDDIRASYKKLLTFADGLQRQRDIVVGKTEAAVGTPDDPASSLQQINAAFDGATGDAQLALSGIGDPKQISQSGQQAKADVDKLFQASLQNLSKGAAEIVDEGKKTISSQKATFAVRQKESGDRISASVSKGLKQVDAGVGSSVKDLGAAKKILQGDITDVLLDLGSRNVKGSGLLGAIARSAATTGTANFQLAQATTTASSYANVRQGDVADLLLRQAQAQAGQEAQAALPAFALTLPDSTQHTTVYSLHVTP